MSYRLVALTKNDEGVQPIAVGSTLRCLVAKVAAQFVLDDMTACLLAPRQLGFGVKGVAVVISTLMMQWWSYRFL